MEDVCTVKVKSKPDTRNSYPSERRYSASTVSGLAWVHIALAATSCLLACLALINQSSDNVKHLKLNETEQKIDEKTDFLRNSTDELNFNNVTSYNLESHTDNWFILVIAASLLTVFALSAGIASIIASVRWYIDHNITWLLVMSTLSTIFSCISFIMVLVWFTSSEGKSGIAEFYKDGNFKDYFTVKVSDIVQKNESHIIVGRNETLSEPNSNLFTKRVLSINVLIAAFLEFLWSILSAKIAYKGMRNNYKDDDRREGNNLEVVTTVKGNDTRRLRLAPKPDLIDHYPNKTIKRILLSRDDNGFYLKNHNGEDKGREETNSEYKERMIQFFNGCHGSSERTSSIRSEMNTDRVEETAITPTTPTRTITPISWGDSPEHTVYNQNNINFERVFKFGPKTGTKELDRDLKLNDSSE